MQQPVNKSSDERFWLHFAGCSKRLAECASETDLPAGWWNWALLRRAEELLAIAPTSGLADAWNRETVARVAIRALMVCEEAPSDFKVTLQDRIIAMRKLVERKGQDYNAGGVSILEYWPQGAGNIVHEIHKRSLRLLSIGRSGQQPRFEDTAEIGLDIAAYSLFLLAYVDAES